MKKTENPDESGTETTTPAETRTAKIRITRNGVHAKGFTFAKGEIVTDVPLAHAEHLKSAGTAEILEAI